jgi:hypothetical protein
MTKPHEHHLKEKSILSKFAYLNEKGMHTEQQTTVSSTQLLNLRKADSQASKIRRREQRTVSCFHLQLKINN